MITHPFLAIQSNNIAPNFEVQIKSGLQSLSLKVNSLEQTASITNSNSSIKFDDFQTNKITFTGRPGLEPSAFNVQTNNNSFLTKSEATALFGSGGNGNGGGNVSEVTSLIASDRSSSTISDRGILTINDQATANQIIIRADSQSIAPFTFGNSSLLLLSKSAGVVSDGGSL